MSTKEEAMKKSINDIFLTVNDLVTDSKIAKEKISSEVKYMKDDMNEKWSNIQGEIREMKLLLSEKVASKEYVDTKFASLDQKYSPTKQTLTWVGVVLGGTILAAFGSFLINGGFAK